MIDIARRAACERVWGVGFREAQKVVNPPHPHEREAVNHAWPCPGSQPGRAYCWYLGSQGTYGDSVERRPVDSLEHREQIHVGLVDWKLIGEGIGTVSETPLDARSVTSDRSGTHLFPGLGFRRWGL